MDSKPAAKDPLYSDNYKTDDWAWGISLGEGKQNSKPRLIINLEHRRFRKCEVRLVEKGQKQEGGHQSNEEEGHHPEQARGPHREREENS